MPDATIGTRDRLPQGGTRVPRFMEKAAIVTSLIDQLRAAYGRAKSALADAAEGATGDDTKAEGKYDTRGLESSYLAAGQAEVADELSNALAKVESFEFVDFDFDDPVASGALVEIERAGESQWYLLAPAGGGITCEEPGTGISVTVIGPSSPLRGALIGKRSGESDSASGVTVLEVF